MQHELHVKADEIRLILISLCIPTSTFLDSNSGYTMFCWWVRGTYDQIYDQPVVVNFCLSSDRSGRTYTERKFTTVSWVLCIHRCDVSQGRFSTSATTNETYMTRIHKYSTGSMLRRQLGLARFAFYLPVSRSVLVWVPHVYVQ